MKSEPQLTGASWYPEMWPEAEWPKDIARMRELGFNIVRVFEFAWHRFEPFEGQYDFAWAKHVMDLCHAAGIHVMIGTPTAAPPAWLTQKYPEVLRVNADGKPATHGMRHHYSVYSRKYRELCAQLVERMVAELAGHPALHSWQIDNEMAGTCFSAEAKAGFRDWLRQEYGTIEDLNATWGLEFWSQAYQNFDQIPLPTASVGSIEVPERHHPSLIMAAARYNNDAWHSFIKLQCDIIRQQSAKPVTSNMTGSPGMDWFRHNRLFDRVGYSVYSDLDHYDWTVERYDRMRPEKSVPYWLLETAPNWSGGGRQWNIHHSADGVRAMTWLTTLLGGSMMLYWQWRSHWAGQEMQHGTCVTATGKWRPNKDAWQRVAAERAAQAGWLDAHPAVPADIAIVQSNRAAWGFSIDPITDDMKYGERWRNDHYLPLVQHHLWRDIIADDADITRYKVLLLPLLPIVPGKLRDQLGPWLRNGGRLLLGPLTGYRTEEWTTPRDRELSGLEDLIGAEVTTQFSAQWIENQINVDFGDGSTVRPIGFCDGYAPGTGKVLATYQTVVAGRDEPPARPSVRNPAGDPAGRPYQGKHYGDGAAAVIENQVGKGKVIALGCRTDAATYHRLVRRLCADAGIHPLAEGGDGKVIVAKRGDTGLGIVNISEQPRTITLPAAGKDLLTGKVASTKRELRPLEVLLLES